MGRKPSPLRDYEAVKRMHGEGATDREIGEALGVAGRTVMDWRRSLGLERNTGRPALVDEPLVRHLHGEGASDGEIGKALRVPRRTVWGWRQRLGLASNFEVGAIALRRSEEH